MELKNQQQTTSSPDHHHHHLPFQYSLTDHPPLNPDPAAASPSSLVRYGQCLKNHAVKIGSHVLDGCGEFMPSGEDGTPDSFKCAACKCHRSFHRRVLEEEHITNARLNLPAYAPPPYNSQHFNGNNTNQYPTWSRVAPVMMTFGGSAETLAESSSDGAEASGKQKKRFRTKFSGEQKAKMMEMANKLGWKVQKDDEQQVHKFCNEIGVKKLNFKVWMHNNKQPINNNSSG